MRSIVMMYDIQRGLARAALRIYPRWWRERYGEELLSLIDMQPMTLRTLFDVCRGALRERVASSLAWQLPAAAVFAVVPFMVMYSLLPPVMTGRMLWGDPLLALILDPRPLAQLWLTPLAIAVCGNLALRRVASLVSVSWKTAALSALFCAVVGHSVLLVMPVSTPLNAMSDAFAEGRAAEFVLSAARWRQVWPQLLVLYAGFGAVGVIAHDLIAMPHGTARVAGVR